MSVHLTVNYIAGESGCDDCIQVETRFDPASGKIQILDNDRWRDARPMTKFSQEDQPVIDSIIEWIEDHEE